MSRTIWLVLLISAAGGGVFYVCDAPHREVRWWKSQIAANIPLGTPVAEVKQWLHTQSSTQSTDPLELDSYDDGRGLRAGRYVEYFVGNGDFDIWCRFDEKGGLESYEVEWCSWCP